MHSRLRSGRATVTSRITRPTKAVYDGLHATANRQGALTILYLPQVWVWCSCCCATLLGNSAARSILFTR